MTMQCDIVILADVKSNKRSHPIPAIADTGADITCLPAAPLEALGVKRLHSMAFTDAAGQRTVREVGYAWIEVAGRHAKVLVQFNSGPDAILLSGEAMASLRLAPDTGVRKFIDTTIRSKLEYI